MAKKKWKDMNVEERIKKLSDIQKEVQENIKKQEKIEKEKRRKLLKLKEKEKIKELEYKFKLKEISVKEINKTFSDIERILKEIGEKRYGEKPYDYAVYREDSEDRTFLFYHAELRWPSHYASFIDSIYINNDGELKINFLRGENEISNNKKSLKKEAQQIYNELKEKLIHL